MLTETDKIIKTLDPSFTQCQCCKEFKTKDAFDIAKQAQISSCFEGHIRLVVCTECKSDFKEALKKRDENAEIIGRGAEIGMY